MSQMEIEIDGLELMGFHGATRAEQETGQRFLIEALAAAIADALVERFEISRVRVRVRKPEVELDAPAAFTAATIEREHR